MKRIGLLKEENGRSLVALSPTNVKKLVTDYSVFVEEDAGISAGFSNEEYRSCGASIVKDKTALIQTSELIISYAGQIKIADIEEEKVIVGCYHVLDGYEHLAFVRHKKVTFYSLDLLPRTTLAQSMDVLSSLASLSGYQAVLTGLMKAKKVAPMISGAGGTLYPAKVLVLGVGVAGLQAIATAKRLGAIVTAFDVRKQTKEEVESLGAKFIEIEGASEDSESGGYAIEQAEDFNRKIQETIAQNVIDFDLIVTTAKIPGRKAPILITQEALIGMKKNSVIVDLAANTGGNVAFDTHSSASSHVSIIGESELFNTVAQSASILLGNNIMSFLNYLNTHVDHIENDAILNGSLVSKNGEIVHERLLNK
jgi:NAD(P) transhydrogenase subunit alpha